MTVLLTALPPPDAFPQYEGAMVAGRLWSWGDTSVEVSAHDLTALEAAVLWMNAEPLVDHDRQLAKLNAAILVVNAVKLPLWPYAHMENNEEVAAPTDNWNPRQLVALADDVVAAHAQMGSGAPGYVDIEVSTAGGAVEDSGVRTRVGQRAYQLLQADSRFVIRVMSQ